MVAQGRAAAAAAMAVCWKGRSDRHVGPCWATDACTGRPGGARAAADRDYVCRGLWRRVDHDDLGQWEIWIVLCTAC